MFTKVLFRFHSRWLSWITRKFDDLDTVLAIMSEQQDHVKAAFVRVCTFDRLGMRHTCCVHTSFVDGIVSRRSLDRLDRLDRLEPIIEVMDHLEAEEIREEDRYLAENLEELMIEFKARLRDRTQSFRDFLKWWMGRMDEVDEEDDTIPDEDIETMVDIGVRLEI